MSKEAPRPQRFPRPEHERLPPGIKGELRGRRLMHMEGFFDAVLDHLMHYQVAFEGAERRRVIYDPLPERDAKALISINRDFLLDWFEEDEPAYEAALTLKRHGELGPPPPKASPEQLLGECPPAAPGGCPCAHRHEGDASVRPCGMEGAAEGAVEAQETAPVLYEEARRKNVKLRWHRGKKTLYADGAKGRYEMKRQRANRRKGIFPIALSLNGVPLKSYEKVIQAKNGAQRHDSKALPASSSIPATPAPGAPTPVSHCQPFLQPQRDEAKFAVCLAMADKIGPIDSPRKLYDLIQSYMGAQDTEVFVVVSTDLHGKLRSFTEVARGQRDRVAVAVEDILASVLMGGGASQFYVAHCHPSTALRPSTADRQLTKDIETASKFYSRLVFVDHIVTSPKGFFSIRENKGYKA